MKPKLNNAKVFSPWGWSDGWSWPVRRSVCPVSLGKWMTRSFHSLPADGTHEPCLCEGFYPLQTETSCQALSCYVKISRFNILSSEPDSEHTQLACWGGVTFMTPKTLFRGLTRIRQWPRTEIQNQQLTSDFGSQIFISSLSLRCWMRLTVSGVASLVSLVKKQDGSRSAGHVDSDPYVWIH